MNAAFPDRLHLEDAGLIHGSRIFKLERDFRFFSSKGVITVPAGFITDGASIPRIFWNILNPFDSYFPAALAHDYLYSCLNNKFSRAEADILLLEGMELVGVPWITRRTIYSAVRLFGWRFFKGS